MKTFRQINAIANLCHAYLQAGGYVLVQTAGGLRLQHTDGRLVREYELTADESMVVMLGTIRTDNLY